MTSTRTRGAVLLVALAAIVLSLRGPWPTVPTGHGEEDRGGAPLDPALLDAMSRAATDAADEGVELTVTSGRRSPEHQARLFREAVAKYGSEQAAARWVARPTTSAHVSGDAVDVGPAEART